MAIYKSIRQEDGVTTNYHRILFLDLVTNHHISIAVLSYVDQEARTNENGEYTPYCKSTTYEIEYDETMTISKAYDYLKTLPEFTGAEDV